MLGWAFGLLLQHPLRRPVRKLMLLPLALAARRGGVRDPARRRGAARGAGGADRLAAAGSGRAGGPGRAGAASGDDRRGFGRRRCCCRSSACRPASGAISAAAPGAAPDGSRVASGRGSAALGGFLLRSWRVAARGAAAGTGPGRLADRGIARRRRPRSVVTPLPQRREPRMSSSTPRRPPRPPAQPRERGADCRGGGRPAGAAGAAAAETGVAAGAGRARMRARRSISAPAPEPVLPSLGLLTNAAGGADRGGRRGGAGPERPHARNRARGLRRARPDRAGAAGPGRDLVRAGAGAGDQGVARHRPGRRHRPFDERHFGARRGRARTHRDRHRIAEPQGRDRLSARAARLAGLREAWRAARPGARQGHLGRAGHRRSRAHAASVDRRHDRLRQIGRHQHDDPVDPVPDAARHVQIHHDRPEDAGIVGL